MGIIINEVSTIYSDYDSSERNKKEKEYLDYINDHIANVKKAYEMYMLPLLSINVIPCTSVSSDELKDAIRHCEDRILHHDSSKFSDDEFDGYRMKYYPTELEKSSENWEQISSDRSERCWVHHYTVNDHHPEHWKDQLTNQLKDMSLDAIVEMICDWEAMSMKFDDILTWYRNEGYKKEMTETTRKIVEDLIFNVLHNTKA